MWKLPRWLDPTGDDRDLSDSGDAQNDLDDAQDDLDDGHATDGAEGNDSDADVGGVGGVGVVPRLRRCEWSARFESAVYAVDASVGASGRVVATTGDNVVVALSPGCGDSCTVEQVLKTSDVLYTVALSANGERVAAAGRSETVTIWSLPAGTVEFVLTAARGPRACSLQTACIMAVAWADANMVLAGGYGGNLDLWTLAPSLLAPAGDT